MKITYFAHSTTTDNENNIATGWFPGELSKLGLQQAEELADHTKDRTFTAVFCSDLKRAIDTARIAFGDRLQIVQDNRLRECNWGDWNGKPHTFKEKLEDYINNPFPNGESLKDVQVRMDDFLEKTKERYNDGWIALVAHEVPQLALEVICNDKTWKEAIDTNWRRTKSWQPGWDYRF